MSEDAHEVAERLGARAAPRGTRRRHPTVIMDGGIRELWGFTLGALAGPWANAVAWLRRGRVFHPEGATYAAKVEPISTSRPPHGAERLAGHAIVRLSGAVFRGEPRRGDILGCAVRLRRSSTPSVEPDADDQDLLFATVRHLVTLPLAMLTTRSDDYLANAYYTVGFFRDVELGEVTFRLEPERARDGRAAGDTAPADGKAGSSRRPRTARLDGAVRAGQAAFRLEYRTRGGHAFEPLVRIVLLERVSLDEAKLRFSPFRAGRGLVPTGALQALRAVPYRASQLGRSLRREKTSPPAPATVVSLPKRVSPHTNGHGRFVEPPRP